MERKVYHTHFCSLLFENECIYLKVQLCCCLVVTYVCVVLEFFTVCTKLAKMAILYSKDLTTAKKKLPPVGLNLMLQIITGLGVQCLTI